MLIANIMIAAVSVLTQGELTVRPNHCPKCPFFMRLAADGKSGAVNTARVSEEDYPKMAARALHLMQQAQDAKKGGALRPTLGWSSWNAFGVDITEAKILETAELMATNGLKAAGYRYVNIDDGFMGGRGKDGKLLVNPVKFPNGLKPVVDRIHALGFKAGIYSDAGSDTCGSMYCGDKFGVGSGFYGHDDDDCRFYFGECGFDFIKIDWCGGRKLKLDEETRYTAIRRAMDKVKPGVRMNVCRWAYPGKWAEKIADSWRTTDDIHANWPRMKMVALANIKLADRASLGHYNDMDMLEVGYIKGSAKSPFGGRDSGLTRLEEQTHFGLWCFMSSPILLGYDIRKNDEITLALVTNPFLLAMNQNDLGAVVETVKAENGCFTLVKDCETANGTARYLAFFNASDAEHDFSVAFESLALGGSVRVFDLVERADRGAFSESFGMSIPAHGAGFYRLDAEKRLAPAAAGK